MQRSWPAIIAHADMDAFYAAVEQLDDPRLRGRPVLVGPNSGRGVVLTASYEARPFGVGSAMPMARARVLCPDAVIVSPRFARYSAVSARVMAVFRDFSPVVEPLSLDEAFLDMTGSEHLFGTPEAMAVRIRAAVRAATGLAVSVGVSATKFVAKAASAHAKPDGLRIVPPDQAANWLATLPVSWLWGAGPKTTARLERLGYRVIGDIASADADRLARELGAAGRHFHHLARAEDARPVHARRTAHSMGSDRTLERDVSDPVQIGALLRQSADRVAERLRARGLVAQGVRVKLKTTRFRLLTRQTLLARPTDVGGQLHAAAMTLLGQFPDAGPWRLVGLAAFEISTAGAPAQADLFGDVRPDARARQLEVTMDRVRARFGTAALRRGLRPQRDLDDETVMGDAPTLDVFPDGESC